MDMLDKAIEIATKAHRGQKRRNGEPYIDHPKRVAEGVKTKKEKIIAWLHDTLEDTEIIESDLRTAGFDSSVIVAVVTLTKKQGENYYNYIERIIREGSAEAVNVKKSDLMDNLWDLDEGSMKDKYRFAYKRLLENRCP